MNPKRSSFLRGRPECIHFYSFLIFAERGNEIDFSSHSLIKKLVYYVAGTAFVNTSQEHIILRQNDSDDFMGA